jgi:Zn-dependent protease with chaperone function
LAVAIVGGIAAFESQILKWRNYRRLSVQETRRVAGLMQQVAAEMGLPDLPRFAMADLAIPAAWTYMTHIVLTTALLETLDDRELAAVLGHELHHWSRGDSVAQHFIWACAWPLAALYNLGKYASGFRLSVSTQGLTVGRRVVPFLAWMIAWPSYVLVRFVITPAAASGMRRSEYAADAAVVKIGRGPDLAAALRKLTVFEPGRTGWEAALYGTHPPTALRIERLIPGADDDDDYREPELGVIDAERGHRFGVVAVGVIVALIVVGAVIDHSRKPDNGQAHVASQGQTQGGPSGNGGPTDASVTTSTPPTTQPPGTSAEITTAKFVTAYFNSLNSFGYRDVVAQYADPRQSRVLQQVADTNIRNSGYQITSSSAEVIGCAWQASPPAVATRVKWTYADTSLRTNTVYFNDPITLTSLNGDWRAVAIPDLPDLNAPDIHQSQLPEGFTACPQH